MKNILLIAALTMALAGCASKKVALPTTNLPAKPESTDVPPERLSAAEAEKCKDAGADARNVCRKVEKNAIIAEDQQEFVDRLYRERDKK